MKPTLAKTSFQTGADETLATPDVYNDAPQSPVGAIQDSINSGNLIQGLDLKQGLNDILSQDLDSFSDTYSQLEKGIKTVTQVLNGDKNLIKDLSKTMVGDLLGSAGYGPAATDFAGALISGEDPISSLGTIASAIPEYKMVMDGVDIIVNAKDIDSIEDLLTVAEKVSGIEGINKLVPIGPTLSIVKGLVDKANILGIPQLATALINTIDNDDDKKRVEIGSALGAARSSNTDMLDDLMSRYGAESIRGTYPKIVKELLSNYKHPKGTLNVTILDTQNLVARCESLDKEWLTTSRENEQIYKTDTLIGLSTDARELLVLDDTIRPIVLLSEQHPVTSLIGLAQRQYPYTPIPVA